MAEGVSVLTVRNKRAHQSSQEAPSSEVFRDVDTLGKVLAMIGASESALKQIETVKAEVVAQMAAKQYAPQVQPTVVAALESPPQTKLNQPTELVAAIGPGSLFATGDLVALKSNPATQIPVMAVIEATVGERSYRVWHNNAQATFYESQLQAVVTEPEQTQLSAEAVNAALTSLHLLAPSTAHLYSLRSGRIEFDPYQYRPVLKLIRADRPRLLIADEVGVGKTIEAGLIIKELQARMDLKSVLIICPKALVAERKWFLEMKRFEEHFTTLNGPMLVSPKLCV